MNILNIQYPYVEIEPITCSVNRHTLVLLRDDWSQNKITKNTRPIIIERRICKISYLTYLSTLSYQILDIFILSISHLSPLRMCHIWYKSKLPSGRGRVGSAGVGSRNYIYYETSQISIEIILLGFRFFNITLLLICDVEIF